MRPMMVMAGERSPFSPPLEVSSNDSKRDTVILSSFRLSMRLYFSCLLLAFRSILLQLKQRKRCAVKLREHLQAQRKSNQRIIKQQKMM